MKSKTAAWWKEEIDRAAVSKEQYSHNDKWDMLEKAYGQNQEKDKDGLLNLIYAYGRTLIPSLIFSNPTIINTPSRPEFIPWANIMDSVDTWLVKEMELAGSMKQAVTQAYLYNMGAVQVGFDFASPIDFRTNKVAQELDELQKGNASVPIARADRARRQNCPWLDNVHARRLLLDPLASSERNCRWYGKMLALPTELLKDLAKPMRLNKTAIVGTHIPENMRAYDKNNPIHKQREAEVYTIFYEIHDAETGTWFWITSEGAFLTQPESDPLQIDGLPLRMLTFNDNTNSIWGTPDALYIQPQQEEVNDVIYMGRLQRRLALLKGLIDPELMDEADVEKFFESPMPFIRLKDVPANKDISKAIHLIQPHVQMELLQYKKDILSDGQLILGFGPNQLGTFSPGRRTKYEAEVVENRYDLRIQDRRQMVANVITGIMKITNQLIIRHWEKPLPVRVLGVDGMMYWVDSRPQDIKQEMETSVDVESLQPPNTQKMKNELMQMLQVLAKVPNINIVPMVRKLLSKMPQVNPDEILPQGNAPTQAMGQEEFAAKQLNVMNNPQIGAMRQKNLSGLQAMMGG